MKKNKKIIISKEAPAAIGPYSQAVEFGDFVFLSGQIGVDPLSGELAKGIDKQTKQVFKNLNAVLKASGLSLINVVRADVFLADMNDFQKMNEIYGTFFKKDPPARQTVQVAALPRAALVEISCIAYKNDK